MHDVPKPQKYSVHLLAKACQKNDKYLNNFNLTTSKDELCFTYAKYLHNFNFTTSKEEPCIYICQVLEYQTLKIFMSSHLLAVNIFDHYCKISFKKVVSC
jgi:hypothetical protein